MSAEQTKGSERKKVSGPETLYQIVGVDPQADSNSIRAAYRRLARRYHPDLNPNLKDATIRMSRLNLAYEVLISSESRARYHRYILTEKHKQDKKSSRREGASRTHDRSEIRSIRRSFVASRTMRSVGYNYREKVLVVQFHSGAIFFFENVPRTVYHRLMKSPSPGKFLKSNVTNNYGRHRL